MPIAAPGDPHCVQGLVRRQQEQSLAAAGQEREFVPGSEMSGFLSTAPLLTIEDALKELNAHSHQHRSAGQDMVVHGMAARRNNDTDRAKQSNLLGNASDPRYNTLLDQKLAEAMSRMSQCDESLLMSGRAESGESSRYSSHILGLILRCVLEARTSGRVLTVAGGAFPPHWSSHYSKWQARAQQREQMKQECQEAQEALSLLEDAYCGPRQFLRHTNIVGRTSDADRAMLNLPPWSRQPSPEQFISQVREAVDEPMRKIESLYRAPLWMHSSLPRDGLSKEWWDGMEKALKSWQSLYTLARYPVSLKKAFMGSNRATLLETLPKLIKLCPNLPVSALIWQSAIHGPHWNSAINALERLATAQKHAARVLHALEDETIIQSVNRKYLDHDRTVFTKVLIVLDSIRVCSWHHPNQMLAGQPAGC